MQLHIDILLMPIPFIVMDFIGKFQPLPQGNRYPLTVMDMLTNYISCIPLYTKEPDKVLHAYLVNIYSAFGWSYKILLNSGTEFKGKLFVQVSSSLGMKQVFCPPYYP